jgi:large repetitive protein
VARPSDALGLNTEETLISAVPIAAPERKELRMRLRYPFVAAVVLALALVPVALALKIASTPPPNGDVGKSYTFRFQPEAGQGCTPYEFKFLNGGLPPGLSIGSDGTMSGIPTTAGDYKFYVEMKSCAGNATQRQFSMSILAKLTITGPEPLPDATINQPYSPVQLTASGGTASSWAAGAGLPPGMTLSSSGQLSGTPTTSGDFSFRVDVSGSATGDNHVFNLHVAAPLVLGGPKDLDPKEPVSLNWKVGAPVAWGVKAAGGRQPYTYTSTTLPTGITLNPDGTMVGAATAAGATPVTFTVTDAAGGTDTLQVVITIKALLAFSAIVKPKVGKVGKVYSWKLPVTGASKTKLFVASGTYPPGLSLDETTGILSGTPLQAGNYKVKFWVLGDTGTQISKTYAIKITP